MIYPEPNKLYRQYKGELYKVLFLSKNTETQEILVNYQSLHFGSYHSIPLDSWNESVIIDGKEEKRFQLENV